MLRPLEKQKKGKAAGPDGVPMEILQMFPVTFAKLLYELLQLVRASCGSALMPRQGPPGYNPYTWGSGINYQPASLNQGA